MQTPHYWPIAGDPLFYQGFSQDNWSDGYGHCYAGPMPDATQEIDCGQIFTNGMWMCDATHCATASQMTPDHDAFYKADIAFDGATANGSILMGPENYALRLTRGD